MRLIWLAIARFEGSTVISGETIVTEFLSDLTTPGSRINGNARLLRRPWALGSQSS
jgi:hypothetical protein